MPSEHRPFGTWPSPVSAEMVAGKSLRFGTLQADGGALFWSESRPDEGGRGVIVRAAPGGAVADILPPPHSARSRVHEYGGGEFLARDGRVFFVEAESQEIHELLPDAPPRRLTHSADTRFADMALDSPRDRLIAVAERHGADAHNPENFLAAVSLSGAGAAHELITGRDFYSSPRISPDGRKLAWLAWDLPHMPWECAALHVAEIAADGAMDAGEVIAGGGDSAVFQPEWSADSRLFFVWDAGGWGALHVWDGDRIAPVAEREAELIRPHWVFRMQSYALLDEQRIAAAYIEDGETRLTLIEATGGTMTPIDCGLRSIDGLAPFAGELAVIGTSDTAPPAVSRVSVEGDLRVLRSAGQTGLAPDDISGGEMLRLKTKGDPLHALYYPPANAACAGPHGERPPLIILVHGGPTGMADRGLKLKTQYWTSRGFAVCDLDYSGSAGYGRAYRQRLDGQWGVRDVEDVAAMADHLFETGRADPNRLLISGGSAGGYTALMALAALDIFAAGACAYAVADLAQLQRSTHKFEAGYLYRLTGTTEKTCGPVFAERSPVNRAQDITSPVMFFQGLDDKVVPPEQSRAMAQSLRERGVPVAIREFADEAHGFRRAETLVEVLECEYAFYARILGLEPAEPLREVEIENWSG